MKIALFAAAAVLLPAAGHTADFNGGRIQIIGGWDSFSYKDDSRGIDQSKSDAGFGIASGYDFQVSPGAIIGFGMSTILSKISSTRTNGADSYKVDVKRDIEASVRAGGIVNDAALIYAKVGYDNAKVKVHTDIGGIEDSDSRSDGGFRVGAGTEIALANKIAMVLEYRYSTYGHGFTRNQILTGVGFRF